MCKIFRNCVFLEYVCFFWKKVCGYGFWLADKFCVCAWLDRMLVKAWANAIEKKSPRPNQLSSEIYSLITNFFESRRNSKLKLFG